MNGLENKYPTDKTRPRMKRESVSQQIMDYESNALGGGKLGGQRTPKDEGVFGDKSYSENDYYEEVATKSPSDTSTDDIGLTEASGDIIDEISTISSDPDDLSSSTPPGTDLSLFRQGGSLDNEDKERTTTESEFEDTSGAARNEAKDLEDIFETGVQDFKIGQYPFESKETLRYILDIVSEVSILKLNCIRNA